MAKSTLTTIIRSLLKDEEITINDTPVFVYQAQVNSVCFASEPEELGDHPHNFGWYKWSEVLPQFDEDVRERVAIALNNERRLRESTKVIRKESAKVERQELRAAEQKALEEMKSFEDELFPEEPVGQPVTKVAEPKEPKMKRWVIRNGKAWSPNGRPWNIERETSDGYFVHSRKSSRRGFVTRDGDYKTL